MKIKEARQAYSKTDARGYKMGARAFNNLSYNQMLETTRNLAKQTNRQFKKMVDEGYKTPAVRGLIKEISGETQLNGLNNTEMYNAGKISVSTNDTIEELRAKAENSIKFMEAKTHTAKGAERAEKMSIETLAQNSNVDLSQISRDQRNDMWAKIDELKNQQGIFASDWALGSSKVLEKIVTHMNQNKNLGIRDMLDDFVNYEYYGGRQNESLNSLFYD